jgi:hypothetical protein
MFFFFKFTKYKMVIRRTAVVCKASPPQIKHIWFLPYQKGAIAKKPKELDGKSTN